MANDRNLKLINLFALLSSAWFFVPVLLALSKDELGVTYQGMLMSEAFFAASCVVFDVPTGWIADVWHRKNALATGAAVNVLGAATLLVSKNIWGLFLSQVIMGIGVSLFNGTLTALLYDTLLSLGRTGEYRKREGTRQALVLYGCAFAGITGGLIYPKDHFLPVILCIIFFSVVFLVACAIHEPVRHKSIDKKHPIKDITVALKILSHGHNGVGLVIIMASTLFCFTKTIMWSQQPYYEALGFPIAFNGILMATGWILGGVSSQLAHLLDGKINNFRALFMALGASIVLCLLAGCDKGWVGVGALIIAGSCTYGVVSPRINEIINKSVDSSRRATLLSTQTFLTSLLFIPVSATFGWIADLWGVGPALTTLAFWAVLMGAGLFTWKRDIVAALLKRPRA